MLCGEPPDLDLGAIELQIPALNGCTHTFRAVSHLLDQFLQHRLDGVITARQVWLRQSLVACETKN